MKVVVRITILVLEVVVLVARAASGADEAQLALVTQLVVVGDEDLQQAQPVGAADRRQLIVVCEKLWFRCLRTLSGLSRFAFRKTNHVTKTCFVPGNS